ncbi:restriction endonuclease subunit S [Enterococcus faecium]|uniref:restriction endonuclease subunit S n=1 Tax=Enterococcus faecium TaxID=1352 RepID=UPI003D21A769
MSNDTQPEIRFPGFTDDWEQRKLGDETKILAGGDVDKTKLKENGKYPVLANALTNDGIVGYYDDDFRIKAPAVTVTGRGDVGYAQARRVNFTPVVRLLSVKSKHDVDFLENSINNHKVLVESTGVPQLTAPQLGNYKIFFPTIEEETKIGSLFKKLDTAINIHQRELDLLKETKKGFLQKMFPKNGAKVPEIRFPGFTDDWEQRKSKELCTISTGKGNTQDKIDDGIYPFYVRSATIEKSNDYLYDQEAVLTVGDGVGTGKVFHYVNGKYNLHQRVYRMYDFNYVSAKYFYYYFSNNFYKRVMSMTAKTSVDSVRMEMIADMNIVFPSVKEQEKIVALFSNLDDTIALHQRKLDLLKETKKGFLQKMFV